MGKSRRRGGGHQADGDAADFIREMMRQAAERQARKAQERAASSTSMFATMMALITAMMSQFFTRGGGGGGSGSGGGGNPAGGNAGGPDAEDAPKHQCPFAVLGLEKEAATVDTVKKSFRKAARTWHPDKNDDSDASKEMMVKLNVAYDRCLKSLRDDGKDPDHVPDAEDDDVDFSDDDVGAPDHAGGGNKGGKDSERQREKDEEEAYRAYKKGKKAEERKLRREKYRVQHDGEAPRHGSGNNKKKKKRGGGKGGGGGAGKNTGGSSGGVGGGGGGGSESKFKYSRAHEEKEEAADSKEEEADLRAEANAGAACTLAECDKVEGGVDDDFGHCRVCDAPYCSSECQKKDWKLAGTHKRDCPALGEAHAERKRQRSARKVARAARRVARRQRKELEAKCEAEEAAAEVEKVAAAARQAKVRESMHSEDHDVACAIRASCTQLLYEIFMYEWRGQMYAHVDFDMNTPLHYACYFDNKEAVDVILRVSGGGWVKVIRAKNARDETPLDLYREMEHTDATVLERLAEMEKAAVRQEEAAVEANRINIDWPPIFGVLLVLACTFAVLCAAPTWPFRGSLFTAGFAPPPHANNSNTPNATEAATATATATAAATTAAATAGAGGWGWLLRSIFLSTLYAMFPAECQKGWAQGDCSLPISVFLIASYFLGWMNVYGAADVWVVWEWATQGHIFAYISAPVCGWTWGGCTMVWTYLILAGRSSMDFHGNIDIAEILMAQRYNSLPAKTQIYEACFHKGSISRQLKLVTFLVSTVLIGMFTGLHYISPFTDARTMQMASLDGDMAPTDGAIEEFWTSHICGKCPSPMGVYHRAANVVLSRLGEGKVAAVIRQLSARYIVKVWMLVFIELFAQSWWWLSSCVDVWLAMPAVYTAWCFRRKLGNACSGLFVYLQALKQAFKGSPPPAVPYTYKYTQQQD